MHIPAKNAETFCTRTDRNVSCKLLASTTPRRVNLKLQILLGTFILSAASLGWAGSATAQAVAPKVDDRPTVNDQVEDTFYTFDQPFFFNRRFPRNALWIFGSFPENEISGDGRVSHKLYTELMRLQNTSDPTIRTADLPNPFTSSLQSDPIYVPEAVPPAPFAPSLRQSSAPSAAPARVNQERVRERPVPALW